MKKRKIIHILSFICICLACAGVIYLLLSGMKAEQELEDARTLIYPTKEAALTEGMQEVFEEWKISDIGADQSDCQWTASDDKIAAEYSANDAHYYLAYIDYAGKKYDYLQFFVAEVKSKGDKFGFRRVSSFYDLVPYENRETEEYPSEMIHSETETGATGIPLYFSCGKIKGKDRVYVDGKPASGLKQSEKLGVSVFGLIDKKRHKVEIKYSSQPSKLAKPQNEKQ